MENSTLGKVHMEKRFSSKVTFHGLHPAFHHVWYLYVPACKTCARLGIDCFSGGKVPVVGSTYCTRFATTRTGTVPLPMFCPGITSSGDAFENGRACSWETAPVVH